MGVMSPPGCHPCVRPSKVVTRRSYTDAEKAAALALYETDGPRSVEAQLGVPKATVVGWANAANVRTRKAERAKGSILSVAERKAALALGLLDDIERLRTQLWAPCKRREVHVVNDGRSDGSHVEIVDVKLSQPTFGDQKQLMTSIGIAVDKVQILTGDVTGRTEVLGVGAGGRDALLARAAELDELAQRRAERGAA
jgi:transposase-like protein